jgi:DNA-binding transcriptional LysR family regulator
MRIKDMQKSRSSGELRDWRDIQYFLAVARTGSFSEAGRVLKTNQSTVGRRIAALEDRLGAKLFDRHSRGMRLTPAGKLIFSQAADMEASAAGIERQLAGADNEMTGLVRISITEGLATLWLPPKLVEFQREHPHIMIETVCKDRVVDLAMREADIAVRYARPSVPKLVAKKVGAMDLHLFATKSYVRVFGTPESIDDLYRHRLVDHTALHMNPGWMPWTDIVQRHNAVVYRSNSSASVVSAVRMGMGIGLFPLYVEELDSEFVRLPVETHCSAEIWLVSHEETNKGARIRAVIDHLSDVFDQDRSRWFSRKPRPARSVANQEERRAV